MSARRTKKVAIFGGGCAGVAAAFELTRPERNGEFEVTLYQMGWRLGGKGASGRDAETGRIEEHGLHLWMGFYENAFRFMRDCYGELDLPEGMGREEQLNEPSPHLALYSTGSAEAAE